MLHSPRFPCFLLSLLAVVPIATADAATWYVDASAISGAGTSWSEPFHTIGEAVSAAADGDSVWVAEGTYYTEVIIKKDLILIGGFPAGGGSPASRDANLHPTTISGLFHNENPLEINAQSTVEGFVIRDGALASAIYEASVTLRDCHFTENRSKGLLISRSHVAFVACTISKNLSSTAGGGIQIRESSTVTMTDCVIEDNEGYGSGGGVYCHNSNLTMSRCIIRRNESLHPGGDVVVVAGGLRFGGADPVIFSMENTLIYDNEARERRQVIAGSPHMVIDGCSFIGKFPEDVFLAISGSVSNTIISGATGILGLEEGGTYEITHSNIQGNYPGEGNISDDPLFRDPANGDFRLQHNSPCIDAGAMAGPADDLDGNPRPIDIPGDGRDGDNAFDMGAFEFQLPIPPPNPRADINQDGLRDATDLLLLLQDWHRVSAPSAN